MINISLSIICLIVLSSVITQEIPCLITCCIDCKVDYNCRLCYNLNKRDRDTCPCVEDLSPRQKAGLKIPEGKLAALRIQSSTRVSAESRSFSNSAPSTTTQSSASALSSSPSISFRFSRLSSCKPSCCPNKSCSKSSCPLCYRKFRKNPQSCPCL